MSLHRLTRADTLPAVGREIEAWCTRCKLELDHVITAMDAEEVVQVRCKTCSSVHRYRGGAAAAARAASHVAPTGKASPAPKPKVDAAQRRAAAAKPTQDRLRFERLMKDRDRSQAVTYAPTVAPRSGLLLTHLRFGYGVIEVVDGGKAHVLFEDGERILIMGR
jgi:hypothetical protein